jgi:hypothetical protein
MQGTRGVRGQTEFQVLAVQGIRAAVEVKLGQGLDGQAGPGP